MQSSPEPSTTTVRILVGGGCHVVGFPIGPSLAFPQVAASEIRKIGIEADVEAVQIRLSSLRRFTRKYQQYRPDLVVLQLGHQELGPDLLHRLRCCVGLKEEPRGLQKSVGPYQPCPSASFALNLRWRMSSLLRIILDKLLSIVGYPAFDLATFKRELDHFLSELRVMTTVPVIILSPFPCKEPVARRNRIVTTPIFSGSAEKNKCQFLDMSEDILKDFAKASLGYKKKGTYLYADAYHLSVEGQRFVGLRLAHAIRRALANRHR